MSWINYKISTEFEPVKYLRNCVGEYVPDTSITRTLTTTVHDKTVERMVNVKFYYIIYIIKLF